MIFIDLANPQIVSALISALGGVLAALIAALAASLIGRQIAGRKRLLASLRLAVADIQFLLDVEKEHTKLHKEAFDESFKQTVRDTVRGNGFEWSGRYTPGRSITQAILRGDDVS